MKPVICAEEMNWIDRSTRRRRQMSDFELMKEVAKEMAAQIYAPYNSSKVPFLVLCGPGNNGGDGYCVAEFLRRWGLKIFVLEMFPAATEAARRAKKFCRAKRIQPSSVSPFVVIDAIFGNNQRYGLPSSLAQKLRRVRGRFHIALDVPTGVSDDGVDPQAFKADWTLMVAYPRVFLSSEEVAEACGEISLVGKNFSLPRFSEAQWIEDSDYALPPLKKTAHKSGRVGLWAGSTETPGAAFLAAEAAARMGVGYVELFFAKASRLKIKLQQASFIYHLKPTAFSRARMAEMDAWVLGPGGFSSKAFAAIQSRRCPMVLDAEALPWAQKLSRPERLILTPHPGEFLRLLRSHKINIDLAALKKSRVRYLRAFNQSQPSWTYLKGAPGLLISPDQQIYLNYSLKPVLARAGSGDVLAGILGGALVRGGLRMERAILSGLIFQRKMAEHLSKYPSAIASDQLDFFSKAFLELEG